MRECKGGRAALEVGEMSSRQVEQYEERSMYRGLAATADKYIYGGCEVNDVGPRMRSSTAQSLAAEMLWLILIGQTFFLFREAGLFETMRGNTVDSLHTFRVSLKR